MSFKSDRTRMTRIRRMITDIWDLMNLLSKMLQKYRFSATITTILSSLRDYHTVFHMWLPYYLPFVTTILSSLRDYHTIIPTGLPYCHHFVTTILSSLRCYNTVIPTGLPKCGLSVDEIAAEQRHYGRKKGNSKNQVVVRWWRGGGVEGWSCEVLRFWGFEVL